MRWRGHTSTSPRWRVEGWRGDSTLGSEQAEVRVDSKGVLEGGGEEVEGVWDGAGWGGTRPHQRECWVFWQGEKRGGGWREGGGRLGFGKKGKTR